MDCKHIQQQLGTTAGVYPSIQEHLDVCPECRTYATDLLSIQSLIDTSVSTPALLTQSTLDHCRTLIIKQTTRQPVQGWRQLLESPRFAVITAALCALLLVISVALQFFGQQSSDTAMLVKISVIQVVLQNFMAALFLPALLMFKQKLGGLLTPTTR